MDVIKRHLKTMINERGHELAERITPESYGELQYDLLEHNKEGRDLIREELNLR